MPAVPFQLRFSAALDFSLALRVQTFAFFSLLCLSNFPANVRSGICFIHESESLCGWRFRRQRQASHWRSIALVNNFLESSMVSIDVADGHVYFLLHLMASMFPWCVFKLFLKGPGH